MNPSRADNERCPRCSGNFHCGARDHDPARAQRCACTGLSLCASTLTALRERYATCLCLRCLQQVQANPIDVSK